ncbi:MAG: hypothetical protein WBX15_01070 [Thermoanaerobaculia bacterium]
MQGKVKGVLFLDYVRMLRAAKENDWSLYFEPEEFHYLEERIDPNSWYPMDVFERMGLAILVEVADRDLAKVEAWGRVTIDQLYQQFPDLFVAGDPRESIMRFQILRQALFDYPVAEVVSVRDGSARVEIFYGMSAPAEEAAVHQAVGFFERLMECSGAREAEVQIELRGWESGGKTRLALRWS